MVNIGCKSTLLLLKGSGVHESGSTPDSRIIVPDDTTLSGYTSKAAPLFAQIKHYLRQSQHLTDLRDWLLPMLMNGQVTVR